MDAADELAKGGISVRVIDPFTVKPIDGETIIANAKAAGGKIITVEDHYPEGMLKNSKFLPSVWERRFSANSQVSIFSTLEPQENVVSGKIASDFWMILYLGTVISISQTRLLSVNDRKKDALLMTI